jgi:ketosteroid isomerase-like protein
MPTEAIRAAMAETNQLFDNEVVAKRNFAALDQIYTRDARILPPGMEMISGRDAIKQFWPAAIEAMGVVSSKLSSVEVEAAGDSVVEIGSVTINTGSGSASGKFIVYWRQEDGRWKWHYDIWNLNA